MTFLFYNPFIDHKPDAWVVTAVLFLFGIFFTLCLLVRSIRKPLPELSSITVDNVETIANAIAKQINACENHKDLSKAVEAIGRYEWFHMDNPNAIREAKKLKALLDKRAKEIYEVIEPATLS
jgi:hypothetical protein